MEITYKFNDGILIEHGIELDENGEVTLEYQNAVDPNDIEQSMNKCKELEQMIELIKRVENEHKNNI